MDLILTVRLADADSMLVTIVASKYDLALLTRKPIPKPVAIRMTRNQRNFKNIDSERYR